MPELLTAQEQLKAEFKTTVRDKWYLIKPDDIYVKPIDAMRVHNFPKLEALLTRHYDRLIDTFDATLEQAGRRRGRKIFDTESYYYDQDLKELLPPVLQDIWSELKAIKPQIDARLAKTAPGKQFLPGALFGHVVWDAMRDYSERTQFPMKLLYTTVQSMVTR